MIFEGQPTVAIRHSAVSLLTVIFYTTNKIIEKYSRLYRTKEAIRDIDMYGSIVHSSIVVGFAIATLIAVPINGYDATSIQSRQLQTNLPFNYRATYQADFRHIRDAFCYGGPPVLEVSCYGVFTLLNISHPSITCYKASTAKITNGTTYQCQNTCNATSCESIYLGTNYGSIEFMCEGDDLKQVNAEYTYLAGNDGSCDSSSSTSTRNFHIARLGISCPNDTGRVYVYDDTYTECRFIDSLGGTTDFSSDDNYDVYVCSNGRNCKGLSCSVPFGDITLRTTVSSFLNTCIESNVALTSFPSIAPKVGTRGTKSTFQASWARLYGSDAARAACSNESPTITITCGNGATIFYKNSTDPAMVCTNSNATHLACVGNEDVSTNTFTDVFYECVGLATPTSRVTYPESYVSCVNNAFEITVSQAVTLGVFCDTGVEQFYYARDLVFECAKAEHNFDLVDVEYGFENTRLICSESFRFTMGSSVTETIKEVTVTTDSNWLENPDGCIFPSEITSTPPVATPITSPVTVNPSESPTSIPSITPISLDAPTTDDSRVTTRVPTETNSQNSSILGVAIGCVGGGIAFAAVVGLIIFLRKRDRGGGANNAKTAISQHFHTESNNDDDYTSSIPTYSTSTAPTNAAFANTSQPSQHRTSLPETGHVNAPAQIQTENFASSHPAFRGSPTKNSASIKSPNRSSSNYVVDVKDQCRSVVVRATSPSPLSRVSVQGENIPFAVAVGVSTASSVSSKQSSKKEPPGRISVDP